MQTTVYRNEDREEREQGGRRQRGREGENKEKEEGRTEGRKEEKKGRKIRQINFRRKKELTMYKKIDGKLI